jgi:predicted enzyme related to lactoylglutathione lyase
VKLRRNTFHQLRGDRIMDEQYKQHGAFSWTELMTTDVEGAIDFYGKIFGWTTEKFDGGGDVDYYVSKAGDREIGGIMKIPPEAEGMPPYWGSYVTVDDVDASAKQAVELGGKVLLEPRDIPEVGRFAVIQDPQGACLSIITYAPQE